MGKTKKGLRQSLAWRSIEGSEREEERQKERVKTREAETDRDRLIDCQRVRACIQRTFIEMSEEDGV